MSSADPVLVPIRAVCAMFDLNPNTLRAWERRYAIVSPSRGEGGQRGYGPEDMEAIRSMVDLIRSGVAPAAAAETVLSSRRGAGKRFQRYAPWKQRFAKAVSQLRPDRVLRVCRDAEESLGYSNAVEHVIFPELTRLGDTWHISSGTIAEEHCATLGTRSYLGERCLRLTPRKSNLPTITLACVPGELHDLPLLHLANLLLHTDQVRPLVLVAGLPLAEVLVAASRAESRLLLLSGTIPVASSELRQWVAELKAADWEKKCILAGGAFRNSRIFSETDLRAAAGNYEQSVALILNLLVTRK